MNFDKLSRPAGKDRSRLAVLALVLTAVFAMTA